MDRPSRRELSRPVDPARSTGSGDSEDAAIAGGAEPAAEERRDPAPAGGRLVWFPPRGDPRELARPPLQSAPRSTDAPARACPACGATRSAPTVAREHVACGHVTFDGFVGGEGHRCPKCGERADLESAEGERRDGDADADGRRGPELCGSERGSEAADAGRSPDPEPDGGERRVDGPAAGERTDSRPAAGERTDSPADAGEPVDEPGPDERSDSWSDDRRVAGEAFPVVSTVHSCLRCGRILDRPLGDGTDRDGGGD